MEQRVRMTENTLYYGDYLDPPFGSQATGGSSLSMFHPGTPLVERAP